MHWKTAPVPPPSGALFVDGVDHPELWLWDSWMLETPEGHWRLYCLALSRTDSDGSPIRPSDRNRFSFHVRQFGSLDGGHSWRDLGALIQPGQVGDGADARNVWSGSALLLKDGAVAFGFTGLRNLGPERDFLQTICVATGSGPDRVEAWPDMAISCPMRDHAEIVAKGYYLGPLDSLGSRNGEEGGPILAWRDPFLFETPEGELRAVWSAKVSPTCPAIAHARLKRAGDRLVLHELLPPMELPDAELMTQAEVPKIYRDHRTGDYLLLVSACDRQYEGQPDREVTMVQRLYRSSSPDGPWFSFWRNGSEIPGMAGLFGSTLMNLDLSAGRIRVLGPHTENAGPARHLRFAAAQEIHVGASMSARRAEAS